MQYNTETLKIGKTHIAAAGERWDMIAVQYYGNSTRIAELMVANPQYAGIVIFEGGETVSLPIIKKQKPTMLPEWRR
ncbi:MAG: tail protein X [Selenomonadaceae bacterium]